MSTVKSNNTAYLQCTMLVLYVMGDVKMNNMVSSLRDLYRIIVEKISTRNMNE